MKNKDQKRISRVLLLCAILWTLTAAGQTVVTNPASPFVVPAGVASIKIEVWGGGGGGGGATSFLVTAGGGGGGGGSYKTIIIPVTPGQSYTVTRGAGGTAGAAGATGGTGGTTAVTGPGGSVTVNGGTGGSGGILGFGGGGAGGTGGLFNGGSGGGASSNGAGGGGGAGNAANGTAGGNAATGAGGNGSPNVVPYRGGAGGAFRTSNGAGNAGVSPGGGGGGARTTGNAIGGVGGAGQVVITYTAGAPGITGFSPSEGCPNVSQSVVITGLNFTFLAVTNVLFNGISASSFIVNSDNQLTAIVPNGATSGPVTVVNAIGTSVNSTNFKIKNIPATPTSPVNLTICPGNNGTIGATPSLFSNSLTLTFSISAEPTENNTAPGTSIATVTLPSFPAGTVITGATLSVAGLTAVDGGIFGTSWQSDIRLGLGGAMVNAAAAGTGSLNSAGAFDYSRSFIPTFTLAGGTVNLLYWDNVNDYILGSDALFNVPKTCTLTINYNFTPTISWYNTASGGVFQGSGIPFNPAGTLLLPNTNTPGVYNFHAAAFAEGCLSAGRLLASVNIETPPTAHITSANTSICNGSSTIITGTVSSTGSWNLYLDEDGNTPQASGTGNGPFSISVSPSSTFTYKINTLEETSGAQCEAEPSGMTGSTSVIVNDLPTATLSGTESICQNQQGAMNITFTGSVNWNYTVYDGTFSQSGTSSSTTTTVVIPPNALSIGVHNFTVTALSDANCAGSGSGTAAINVINPTGLTGKHISSVTKIDNSALPLFACNDPSAVYRFKANGIPDFFGLQYQWSKGTNSGNMEFSEDGVSNWAGTLTVTGNSVYVRFLDLTSGFSGYRLCVQAKTVCQSTLNFCPWLQGTVNTPASISGSTVVCPPSTESYSAGASAGAFQYRWTFQPDAGAIQLLTVGTNIENLIIPAYTTSGKLCVSAELACGAGSAGAPRCVTLVKQIAPIAPMSGNSPVCPGTTNNYSIPILNGATSYTWTTPGNNFTTNSSNNIDATFPTPYNGSGQVCVTASGTCSTPVTRCKSITSSTPLVPASLTGPLAGVCTPATVGYTIPSVAGATGYTWTYPTGPSTYASVAGNTTFSFNAPAGFVNGTVSVVAENNNCIPATQSVTRSIPIKGSPARPTSISTTNGQPLNGCPILFTTPFSSGLSYLWSTSLGAGAPIDPPNPNSSGQIVITWGTGTGTVNVTASNSCGSSGSYSQSFTGQAGGCRLAGETTIAGNNSSFSVYPNPAHDRITVEMVNDKSENGVVKITDLSGRLISIAAVNMASGTSYTEIDLTHLAKGPYILSVENSAGVNRQRIVVE